MFSPYCAFQGERAANKGLGGGGRNSPGGDSLVQITNLKQLLFKIANVGNTGVWMNCALLPGQGVGAG